MFDIVSPDPLWNASGKVELLFDDFTPICSLSQKRNEVLATGIKNNDILARLNTEWISGQDMTFLVGGFNDQVKVTLPRDYQTGATLRLRISGRDAGLVASQRLLEDGNMFDGRRLLEDGGRRLTEK